MIHLHAIEGRYFRLAAAAVPAGELAAFVAPTLSCAREFIDILLGLAAPRQGTVTLFGQSLAALDDRGRQALRTRLGFAAQTEGLVSHLALWENILLGVAYRKGVDFAAVEAQLRGLLARCGWSDDDARHAFRLMPDRASPFQRATAAWLRALLCEPDLLVCEDLFSGLGVDQRRRLIDASAAFQAENPGRGSVFVLVGDRLVEELQPTAMFYLSLRGDFRAEASA